MGCLNCGKELEDIPNKRKKKFCNSTCRSNYWQKEQRKLLPLPPDYIEFKNAQIVYPKGVKEEDYSRAKKAITNGSVKNIPFKAINKDAFDGEKINNLTYDEPMQYKQPHKLWKKGDPLENSNAFYFRYGCFCYDELEKQRTQ